jgi:hypothetical protein
MIQQRFSNQVDNHMSSFAVPRGKSNSSKSLFYHDNKPDYLYTQKSTEDSFAVQFGMGSHEQIPAIKSFGLLFDDKENDVVDEEGSSSEEGDYSEDEDKQLQAPDIQSIFSQLNLSELNPPVKSATSTMVGGQYFMNDLQSQVH